VRGIMENTGLYALIGAQHFFRTEDMPRWTRSTSGYTTRRSTRNSFRCGHPQAQSFPRRQEKTCRGSSS
jgi:hypothetical protein